MNRSNRINTVLIVGNVLNGIRLGVFPILFPGMVRNVKCDEQNIILNSL